MDFPNFDPWNSAPSYPMPSPNFQDEVLGFDSNPAFETASTLTQVGPTQYGPHSLNASPLPHDIQPQSFQSFSDTRATNTPPMGPPTGTRKRKAATLHASDWEPYKTRIIELHIKQDLPLKEVKDKIKKEFGFTAEYVLELAIEGMFFLNSDSYELRKQDTTIPNTHKSMELGQEYQTGGDAGHC
jgi:hypothetical protein